MPTELLTAFVGFVVGAAGAGSLVWFLTMARDRQLRDTILDLREQRGAAEARSTMLDDRLARSEDDTDRVRRELRQYEKNWASVTARLNEAHKNLNEQKALIEQAKSVLSQNFQSIAAGALARNNQEFLVLAEQRFKSLKSDATHELDVRKDAIQGMVKDATHAFDVRKDAIQGMVKDATSAFDLRKDAIQALVQPVAESLEKYQAVTTELEQRRQKEMGSIGEQLRAVATAQSQLQSETSRLVGALKSPQVRGRWGEIALRKTAELAGMAAYCDFCEQEGAMGDDGWRRPDMIVKLPNNRSVIVDSKVPLSGFLEALEAMTDDNRVAALNKHAKQVSGHIDRLSAKEYWKQFPSSPEFVVLFIPNDSFLAAAAEQDPELVENGLSKKIVLATPSTFIALLRAIEFGWRQKIAVDNAEVIRNLGQDFSDRFSVLVEHLSKIGGSLGKAVDSFNSAVASFEGRILPQARRFKQLGAGGRKVIEELQPVDSRPRNPTGLDDSESTSLFADTSLQSDVSKDE
jgi:DNA recombination protein RmuC